MIKSVHIISWDIPYPANYGGVIDVFWTLKKLHEQGCKIKLHCFQYGDRFSSEVLNQYCSQVFYYPRKTGMMGLHASLPYIVSSRSDKLLLTNLLQDDAPIIFEGIHSTFLLNEPKLKDRRKILRAQNVEYEYYSQLANNTSLSFKKLYYYFEAMRLYRYERSLQNLQAIATVAMHDFNYFQSLYPTKQVVNIPSFQPDDEVKSLLGTGNYCLYHGNLSVEENEKSALFLIQEVFKELDFPLVIAGKNPADKLMALQGNHISVIANPSDEALNTLIAEAQIHVLPSFQTSGLKLKLLHALFLGRFCVSNANMLVGTGLEGAVIVANTAQEFKSSILQYKDRVFEQSDIEHRNTFLQQYSNKVNASNFIDMLSS
ncbi:MAG: glycosyltransferase [Chitinophagaceae bacterium]|nr:glycosyltransferase [Chitinophagaceae bacterium]